MGFLVCHMQKHQQGAVKGIQYHNQREKESHSNRDIDHSKSGQNYDIVNPSPINYTQAINDRIATLNLKRAVRKDAVRLCSFIVTSDNETMQQFGGKELEHFFTRSVKFFQDRYGKENVIFGQVHMDEATPHLHVGLVPIRDGRLSAKTIFDKNELKSLQTDLHRAVGVDMGLERGLEGSKREHLSTTDYKLAMRTAELERIESKIDDLTAEMTQSEYSKMEELAGLFVKKLELDQKRLSEAQKRPVSGEKDLERYKTPLFDKEAVIAPKDDLRRLMHSDWQFNDLKNDLNDVNKAFRSLQKDLADRKKKSLNARHYEQMQRNKANLYVGQALSEVFEFARPYLHKHFDTIHKALSAIPYGKFKNFALGALEMSLKTNRLDKVMEAGAMGFNEGLVKARARFKLSTSMTEHKKQLAKQAPSTRKNRGFSR